MTSPTFVAITTIMQELRELRQRLDDAPQKICTSNSLPTATVIKEPARSTKRLKETALPVFSGDRTLYLSWRKAVLTTLGMDLNTFGYTNKRAFLLIFNTLDGKAIKQARAYYESGGQDGKEDPEYFILFLDQGNWNGTRIARARTELTNMKMGNKQKWSIFFSAWTNKLTGSHGDNWSDSSKITMLKSTLNYTLRLALANSHNIPIDNFHEFTRIVSQIALQHEDLAGGPPAHQNGGNINVNTGQRFD